MRDGLPQVSIQKIEIQSSLHRVGCTSDGREGAGMGKGPLPAPSPRHGEAV